MTPRVNWNLEMIRAGQALDLLRDGNGKIDWGDIRVCQLDTGYTEHPIFGDWQAGQSWLQPEAGLNLLETGELPKDPLDYEGSPGHGSRICSIICGDAGKLPTSSQTVIGAAPGLPVVPCRVVDSVVLFGVERRNRVAAGLRHAITIGAPVVNMSLGTPTFPSTLKGEMGAAVDEAYEAGIIMAAAGGQVIDRVTYPARFKRTIACGGLTFQQRLWPTYVEHMVEAIDVWAPAVKIARADAHREDATLELDPVEGEDPGSSSPTTIKRWSPSLGSGSGSGSDSSAFGFGEGTSYATAHVSAAAAMWLCRHKSAIENRYTKPWQRVEAFRLTLKKSANSVFGRRRLSNGSGRLSIEALLLAPLPDPASLVKAGEDKDMRA